MRIPKYIQDKMHLVVDYNCKATMAMREVEDWLEKHGIDPDDIRDGGGCSLDELEFGNDIVDELVERLESM